MNLPPLQAGVAQQRPVQAHGLIEVNLPPADEPLEVTLELSKSFSDQNAPEHGLAIIFDTN